MFQIYVFENDSLVAKYNVLEEVKDIAISPPLMFTARDLYVTVTEIKPGKLLLMQWKVSKCPGLEYLAGYVQPVKHLNSII